MPMHGFAAARAPRRPGASAVLVLALACGLAGADADEPAPPAGAPTAAPAAAGDDEPALPEIRTDGGDANGGDGPALPAVEGDQPADGPALPTVEGEPPAPDPGDAEPALPEAPAAPADDDGPRQSWLEVLGVTGFLDVRGGVRTQRDSHQRDASLGEARLQLDLEKPWQRITFKVVADVVYDPVLDHHTIDLERGQGWLDLRQANIALTPLPFMDVKLGRQILTWGTGDLLFLNDLFPKDWQSFFIGRDVEYLKAPSDALKISLFSDLANVDIVYTPAFDADRFIRGERISYWNSQLGRRTGRNAVVRADRPNEWFRNDEWATRIYRNIEGTELAAYGYWGRWKSPGGFDPGAGRATFPRLGVYGGSIRGQLGGGIANVEAAYYDSREDRGGDDPFVNNSQLRLLAGYSQDLPRIASDLNVAVQYYVELMMDHNDYEKSLRGLPGRARIADEDRHVVTVRLTKLLMNQNLELSLFAYYSPTDSDAYLRPAVSYKIDDHWTATVGGNVFLGRYDHTFFAQFERATNVYASLRYSF